MLLQGANIRGSHLFFNSPQLDKNVRENLPIKEKLINDLGNSLLGSALTIVLTTGGTQVNFHNVRLDVTSVPVPAAAWLMGSSLLGLVGASRRKK